MSNFIITVDCEGENYDRDLAGSVAASEDFLEKCLEEKIPVILFITPKFALEFVKQGLYSKYRDSVSFGLHIHPEDLPGSIMAQIDFDCSNGNFNEYTYTQKERIIQLSTQFMEYIGIDNFKYYRSGVFSVDDDILSLVKKYVPSITTESHSMLRVDYAVENPGISLSALPVSATSEAEYLSIDRMSLSDLLLYANDFANEGGTVVAVTHSYMFREGAFRYERDGIEEHITERVLAVAKNVLRSAYLLKKQREHVAHVNKEKSSILDSEGISSFFNS